MLQLIRYKNLIIITLVQWLIYHAIITPILQKYGLYTLLPTNYFWLIVTATVMIAAGSYIINDYFDIKIDQINCPNKVIIGKIIPKKVAMVLYIIISLIGVSIGLIISILLKNLSLSFIFIVIPGILWFYSSSYKRQFLIGNLIVSLCCALSILVLFIAESGLQVAYYGNLIKQTPVLKEVFIWVLGYAIFAFIMTLIREIVKDIEDLEGDRQMECRTLPIVCGEKKAKIVITSLFSISLIVIFLFDWLSFEIPSSNIFLKILSPANIFILFFALFLTILWRSKDKNKYGRLSIILKILILTGILYSLVFYYLLAKTYQLTMFGIFKIV